MQNLTSRPNQDKGGILNSLRIKSLLRRGDSGEDRQTIQASSTRPCCHETPHKRRRTQRKETSQSPKKTRSPFFQRKRAPPTPKSPVEGSLITPSRTKGDFFSTKRKSLFVEVPPTIRETDTPKQERPRNGATTLRVELSPQAAAIFPQRNEQQDSKKLVSRLRQIEQCLKNSHYHGESPRIFKPANPMLVAPPFTPSGRLAVPN